ncbi:MAG TPA: cytochrome P450 [Amycolatopsis sp.]|uniref:cytochrome P450 n=1 Tax=Amycolatopsis sp. TaxID=37632 RepID=UPI002B492E6A|nr:cytochrome P450 [Amycolatopsis sp.]HKS50115.1 cytochrome P450 [Amycolatopsis sp.]
MNAQPEQLTKTWSYPFARESIIDPAPALAQLRESAPIHKVRLATGGDAWLVTRYEDVRALLGSPAFGTQYPGSVPTVDAENLAGGFMFLKDPPEHTRLRRSVSRVFTVRRVAALRERAEVVAAGLVTTMVEKGPVVDVQEEFAYPLPIAIISELLGIPESDRARFRRWADIVLRAVGGGEGFGEAFADLQKFVVALVESKPDGPDLLSELAGQSGEPGGLSRLEIASMAMGLLMAGYVTTASAISHGLLRLFRNPAVPAGIRAGELRITDVVEELLRLQDEEVGINRIALADVDVCGVRVRRGETVIASRVGANRDPRAFRDAESFTVDSPSGQHLAFGHGIHHCLGAALARMELEVAFGTLLTRIPGLRLAVAFSEVEWSADGMDVNIDRLPVAW